jgi:hypothetical protein
VREAGGQVRHALLEFADRLFEAANVGFGPGVEAGQQVGDLARVGEVGFQDAVAVLVENGRRVSSKMVLVRK